ncbi:MAG TPA: hypothetical protein VHC00_19345 [Rhizobiaceae bacterium]|nr:hypothetical protein [Rhizobiaceae bacterium]
MTISLQPELVEEIARDHGFDANRLREALVRAVQAYRDEQAFWAWREQATGNVPDTKPALTAVQRALRLWRALPSELHRDVAYFQDPSSLEDPIGPKLQFVAELLEEYREHYQRPRGNPGHSRTGADHDLRPLQAFAVVLVEFWLTEKDKPFGHVVERYEEASGFDPSKGELAPRVAESEAMEFLMGASECLPHRYDVSNFETVVRRIKRNLHRQ